MSTSIEVTEAPLVRVPFESLKRAAKDRKALVDEAADAVAAALRPAAVAGGGGQQQQAVPAGEQQQQQRQEGVEDDGDRAMTDAAAGEAEPTPSSSSSREGRVEALARLLSQLQGLKRKLREVSCSERDDVQRCKARLEHLVTLGAPARDAVLAWTKQRLDRIIVDHLLREGCYDTAAALVDSAGLGQLADAHIFAEARRVVEALRAHDAAAALAWCDDNRTRLRKIKSKLEFKLHVQQFIELVRAERRLEAIAYARRHLAPWASLYMAELQRAVATLAFTAKTRCTAYRSLFKDSQWDALVDLFLKELYRLQSLTPDSLLHVYLQAGLSALKTLPDAPPASAAAAAATASAAVAPPGAATTTAAASGSSTSSASSGARDDPLRLPAFQALARGLPLAKHVHSKLVCTITHEIMSADNPPVVLPNGYVYSQKGAAQVMALNGGSMRCPRTGALFAPEELRRAFIV